MEWSTSAELYRVVTIWRLQRAHPVNRNLEAGRCFTFYLYDHVDRPKRVVSYPGGCRSDGAPSALICSMVSVGP